MTALMDAVENATESLARNYPINAVPSSPGKPYSTYSASLGRPDGYTLDARHGMRWGRVIVMAVGSDPNSALARMDALVDLLIDERLDVDGWDTGPLRMELDPTPPARDPDAGGLVTTTATLTFTAIAIDEES